MAWAACGLLLVAATACSSSSSPSGTTGSTAPSTATAPAVVNIGYVADMAVPDPDISTRSRVTRWLRRSTKGWSPTPTTAPRSSPPWPRASTSRPDGLTYTFHLRPNVTFHDGATMTANDVNASFQRRTSLIPPSQPAYMLASVTSYDTPDPVTFVVHLGAPVAPFNARDR